MGSHDPSSAHDYLAHEAKARVQIDKQLAAAGWVVQSQEKLNLGAGLGVAVREFILEKPHGRVDYLLFLNGQPAGVIEAKPEGTPLVEVERQSGKYVDGLPEWMKPAVYPLPFIYESTGAETRITNGYDPEARCTPRSVRGTCAPGRTPTRRAMPRPGTDGRVGTVRDAPGQPLTVAQREVSARPRAFPARPFLPLAAGVGVMR